MDPSFTTGFIAIVGRPNVGKSTLMNHLIGQKVSITSRKAQTTRHRITGIRTDAQTQFVFVDTPGFQTQYRNALNQAMNRSVTTTLQEVDVVVFVIEAMRFEAKDQEVLKLLPPNRPVILVINKVDIVDNKEALMPFVQKVSQLFAFHAIVPLSAVKAQKLEVLIEAIRPILPVGPPLYSEEELTDRSERFLASEIIREKLFRLMGEELPYVMAVEIEQFIESITERGLPIRRIHAAILVDNDNQKAMVIGKKGEKLKKIASQAREDMEKLFESKVYLEVWVKVKNGWADDTRLIRQYGYE
jgi:GTP-binding protein Era